MKRLIFINIFLLFSLVLFSQVLTQNIRGEVVDKVSKYTLPGAYVILFDDSSSAKGVTTDANGNFLLPSVPIGRHKLKITYIGYQSQVISIVLFSAKELVLNIELNEAYITTKEVIIKASKSEANNEMSAVSSRVFSIEETERYAGSRGDPARMAMNFAGVSGANDQRNDIIIRGNSPSGLLWKLEDVEIPNPNHFSSAGSTGGPVSMLNNNVLSNSDFMTGAFPAEYGNAMSGVFDLRMRSGNTQKHEFMSQFGFNGAEFGAEGPICRSNRSSYLINYRYSTVDFMDKMGMNFGISGIPKYQDLSVKLNFPIKNGIISLFGLGGISSIAMLDSKRDSIDLFAQDGVDLYTGSKLFTAGLSYTQFLNSKTYFKIIISSFSDQAITRIDSLDFNRKPYNYATDNTASNRGTISIILSHKTTKNYSFKTGLTIDRLGYGFITKVLDKSINDYIKLTDEQISIIDGKNMLKYYNQWIINLSEKIALYPGVNFIYFDLNKKYQIEPRASIAWKISGIDKLTLGYGMHSKIQTLYTYFLTTRLPSGDYIQTNKNLDFNKSQHLVLAYDKMLNENLRLKVESYYQFLYKIAVDSRSTSWSALNSGATWGFDAGDSLVNKGTGKNIGLEITLEKFFSKNYYYLLTASLFDSKYKGSDGIERNTAFNGNYVLNALIGKEVVIKKSNVLFFDLKLTYAGGRRYTPINKEESKIQHTTVYYEGKAFSKRANDYIKPDIKIGFRKNGKKVTQEWMVYIENVINRKNMFAQTYDTKNDIITTTNQLGIFPMMQWRIYF
ncbi:MAG: carboxypeptidase-like regulatory domain-containing protein [Bacteroidota bacterium]